MRNRTCTVYGLSGPDGVIRYIGQTRGEIKNRLGTHWRDSKRRPNSRLYKWMRETKKVSIIPIKEDAVWDVTETTLIAEYRKAHPGVLLNLLAGGGDRPPKPAWFKKKRGSKRRQ